MARISKRLLRTAGTLLAATFATLSVGILAVAALYLYVGSELPDTDSLKDVRLQVPLRVFSHDGELIAEFGEKRRNPVDFGDVPSRLVQAFLAAEDDRFFDHPGVDYQGLMRAALNLLLTGEKAQGGSTITMQVARNFFLSSEKTYIRKIREIFLALQIERRLTKEEILELYLNKIYLGNRAYGVQAAARAYYGKDLEELSLAQMAMIAGLPKAPSRYNPIADPRRAGQRRDYVLSRMRALDYIDEAAYGTARAEPITAEAHQQNTEVEAFYVAEAARAEAVERFGDEAYTGGYSVYTTIESTLQNAAVNALRDALHAYDERHGYRGPASKLTPEQMQDGDVLAQTLEQTPTAGALLAGAVTEVSDRQARVYVGEAQDEIVLEWPGLEWAREQKGLNYRGPAPKKAADVVSEGDIVLIRQDETDQWRLAQIPEVSGALVALSPDNGAVRALVGGYDFFTSKFNRALQARRQPGSSFKPFVYSAALEHGYTPASIINDAPVVFDDPALEATWRPENYSGKFYGPTRLREALVNSRNLVSIRLLRSIGIDAASRHAVKFGFERSELPRDLSLALGSGSTTPLRLARGYAVFANGGYRVESHMIARIEDSEGEIVFRARAPRACDDCPEPESPAAATEQPAAPAHAPRVVPAQNVYVMNSMMRDVIRRGTARKARKLGRADLGGKTGTTNDQRDAWFAGFNPEMVAVAWVGFDELQPLGAGETGGRAALPMWMDFMAAALEDRPESFMKEPPGLVTVRIDPDTGLLAGAGTANAVFETFQRDQVPERVSDVTPSAGGDDSGSDRLRPEQIF